MPYKRNYRRRPRDTRYRGRRFKKRTYRKRKQQTLSVNKFPNGVPDRIRIKLNYAVDYSFVDAVGGNELQQTFSGNSIYDPDTTLGGTTVIGWGQWNGFYGKYKVNASKINIQVINQTLAPATALLFGVYPNTTASIPGSLAPVEMTLQPYVRYTCLNGSSNNNGVKMLNSYMGTKKISGQKILDDLWEADIDANPINQWYWHISAVPIDLASTYNIQTIIRITYYVDLFSRDILEF